MDSLVELEGLADKSARQVPGSPTHSPTGELKRIARSLLEPPATNAEAQAAELELEDCPHSEIVEVWPTMRRRWISRW